MSESIVLAAAGGALGLWIAHLAVPAFAHATADIMSAFWIDFRVDATVTLFATLAVAAAGILVGLLPGLRASRANVAEVLKDATASTTGVQLGRMARRLVMVEVALATGLLIMTMTFARTAVALRTIDLPFDAHAVFTAQLALTQTALDDVHQREGVVLVTPGFFDVLGARARSGRRSASSTRLRPSSSSRASVRFS